MRVWILWEETGQYSDYSMGVLGVFDDPEKAKADSDARFDALDRQQRERYPTYTHDHRTLGPWTDEGAGHWVRQANDGHYDRLEYHAVPYEMNTIDKDELDTPA